VDDLKAFVEGNISSVNLGQFSGNGVKFSDVQMTSKYTDNQSIDRSMPLQVTVQHDTFMIQLEWIANVSNVTSSQLYKVNATLSPLEAGYTKIFDKDVKKFHISNTSFSMNSNQLKFLYNISIPDAHKVKI
jgi:hypothetical protein